MNKHDLAKIIAKNNHIDKEKGELIVQTFFDLIAKDLAKGKRSVYSNFGSFYTVHYPSKVINHPRLGSKKKIVMLPTNTVKWMPSGCVKDMVVFGKDIDNATDYGAKKKLNRKVEEEGLVKQKAYEVEDEIVEIPIKIAGRDNVKFEPPKEEVLTPDLRPLNIYHNQAPKADQLSYLNIREELIPTELLAKFPENLTRYYSFAPINEMADQIVVAMADPYDHEAKDAIKKIVGKKDISAYLTTKDELEKVYLLYKNLDREQSLILPKTAESAAPANRFLQSILKKVILDEASDIHIDPFSDEAVIKVRVDGRLKKIMTLNKYVYSTLVMKIKERANLSTDLKTVQQGKFSDNVSGHDIEFQVFVMPVSEGEKITIKIHDKCKQLIPFSDLGFSASDQKKILALTKLQPSLTIVAGRPHSGKSTTLYGILSSYNPDETSIISVENPLKQKVSGIIQSETTKDGLSGKLAIETAVAQDPDVLMVSNISDKETAQSATEAARIGLKVFVSLSSKDSLETLLSLERFGFDLEKISYYLDTIIAQKLVRKICPYCIEEAVISPKDDAIVQSEIERLPQNERELLCKRKLKFFKGRGCKRCSGSGYDKTMLIYEIFEIDQKLKQSLGQKSKAIEIEKAFKEKRYLSMIQYGIIKAIEGKTTLEEVLS